MNSVNAMLQASTREILYQKEKNVAALRKKRHAAILALYNAQGAEMEIRGRLNVCRKESQDAETLFRAALAADQITNNLLTDINLVNATYKTAETNATNRTANIQVTTDSIIGLFSDMEAILAEAQGLDSATALLEQSTYTSQLLRPTAENVEKLAQESLESLAQLAAVSVETELKAAQTIQKNMHELRQALKMDSDKAAVELKATMDELNTVYDARKQAEGTFINAHQAYHVAFNDYKLTNAQLNLNLQVVPEVRKQVRFRVLFDAYSCPFQEDSTEEKNLCKPLGETENLIGKKGNSYPVEEYYIFLVKDRKKKAFELDTAEKLLAQTERWTGVKAERVKVGWKGEKCSFDGMKDVDGDVMKMGEDYVVFVLANLEDAYKQKQHNNENYLSAASLPFCLKKDLKAARNLRMNKQKIQNSDAQVGEGYRLSFQGENTNVLEYRCMFLPMPADNHSTRAFLTIDALQKFEDRLLGMGKIAFEYYMPILKLGTDIETVGLELDSLPSNEPKKLTEIYQTIQDLQLEVNKLLLALNKEVSGSAKQSQIRQIHANIAALTKELANQKTAENLEESAPKDVETEINLELVRKALEKLKTEYSDLNETFDRVEMDLNQTQGSRKGATKPGFWFDLMTAEQVSAANYFLASLPLNDSAAEKTGGETALFHYSIGPDTTDNFGNRLIENRKYLPVVLSYATVPASAQNGFHNALSDMATTRPFIFHPAI